MSGILGHRGLLLSAYDPDAQALFDRLQDPSAELKEKINTLILELKDEGIWDLLDTLYVPARIDDIPGALCDWKRTTKVAIPQGTTTYSELYGFESAGGAGDYIDTDYVPSVDGVNFTLNNASAGCYIITAATAATADYFGANTTTNNIIRLNRFSSGTNHYATVNGPTGASAFDTASLNVAGKLVSCSRSGSGSNTSTYLYVDGVATGTADTADANSLVAATIYIMARNNNGSDINNADAKIAMWYAGAALTTQQLVAFNTAIEAYLA